MVKTRGPLASLSSGGGLHKTMTYSNWKGRQYAKRWTAPSNPQTQAQHAVRDMWRFLAKQWPSLDPEIQDDWTDLAAADNVSWINAYLNTNIRRWHRDETPSYYYPITEAGSVGSTTTYTATAQAPLIAIYHQQAVVNSNWGVIIYQSTSSGFTPSQANLLYVQLADSTLPSIYYWRPPAPGTYYFRWRKFTTTGKSWLSPSERNATV